MSPDYSEYSQKELLEALDSIDKDMYPENYKRLVMELSKKNASSKPIDCTNEAHFESGSSAQRCNTPCSINRVITVMVLGVLGSIPVVALAEPSKLSRAELVLSALMLFIMGLPLVHSFVSGWTISRYGIVTRHEHNFSFTVMQLFYSYICSLVILFAIVRWP